MQTPNTPAASIFTDTIAEMTYPQVEAAIGRGAVALWAMGVIEQHGPHLPTGTDVYIPSARLRAVKHELAARGIEALIIPPFYWGVNVVSANFPASIKVRAEVMIELLKDVMTSLAGDGFKRLFCVSGHNDRAHNEAIFKAMCEGSETSGLHGSFICDEAVVRRLGIDLAHPNVVAFQVPPEQPAGPYLDIHAGGWETSIMLAFDPETVQQDTAKALPDTQLVLDDLVEWRKGHDTSKRITPQGYFGDPATGTAERGRRVIADEARVIADALQQRLG
jgi:creatinine amidohydrolase